IQAEKMASLGIMSAGVAHEINNPIGFVLSNVHTLGRNFRVFFDLSQKVQSLITNAQTGDNVTGELKSLAEFVGNSDLDFLLEDGPDLIAETEEGIERVRDIVAGLKSFAREDSSQMVLASVNDSVESAIKLASRKIQGCCSITVDLAELPDILCFSGKLTQVFLNLIVNATQAVDKGSTITVLSKCTEKWVVVTVADEGPGIPDDVLPNLFTPFFTTKSVGEGTGLGLSISHGIIEEHGGEIDVESEVGVGSRFHVKLPIQEELGNCA
ncbi:MAG: ATP-binding protein, partial [Pseudomonadota bacterium]